MALWAQFSNRWFLLGAACLQNGLTTGLLFGFAALHPVFEQMRDDDTPLIDTGYIFTLAATVNQLAPLFIAGPILDAFGPRVCSCVCTCLVGAGFLVFGVSRSLPGHSMSYLLPSMLLIGIGGPGCQSCLFHTANLFQARGMALNAITAFIGLSFVIFETLASLTFSYGISLQRAFLLYSALPFACAVVSGLTMNDVPFDSSCVADSHSPKVQMSPASFAANLAAFDAHITGADVTHSKLCAERPRSIRSAPAPGRQSGRDISLGSAKPMVFIRRKKTMAKPLRYWSGDGDLHEALLSNDNTSVRDRFPIQHRPSQDKQNGDDNAELIGASLFTQLRSSAFVELTIIFAMSSFFFNMFLGSMQDEAKAVLLASSTLQADVSAVATSQVSTYFTFAPLSGFLNPVLGHFIDQYGFLPTLIMTLLSGMVHAFALWQGAFFVAAAVFSLFQACFFSYMYSYLAFEFGFQYYGLLAGIIQGVASIATLTLRPCLRGVALVHGWRRVQMIQVASFAVLGLLLCCKRLVVWLAKVRRQQSPSPAESLKDLETGAAVRVCQSERIKRHRPPALTSLKGRSFSQGDLHHLELDSPCRRRVGLFPYADDILVIDGAYAHHSQAAYQVSSLDDRMPFQVA